MQKNIRFIDFLKRDSKIVFHRFGEAKLEMLYVLPDLIFMDAPLSLLRYKNGKETNEFQNFKECYLKGNGYTYETRIMDVESKGHIIKYLFLFASKPHMPMYSICFGENEGFFNNLNLKSKKYEDILKRCKEFIDSEIEHYDPIANNYMSIDEEIAFKDRLLEED